MRKFIFVLIFLLFGASWSFAQEQGEGLGERLTQEEFAVELVKDMKLEANLPPAALASDCVDFLERIGIAPLGGWNNKTLLTQEDYLVIISKARGKETMLHQRAMAVEKKNTEIINKKWQESFDKTGQWVSLESFLNDKDYFPNGPPISPYGLAYEDRNGDHKVDPHFLPVAGLIKLRGAFSSL